LKNFSINKHFLGDYTLIRIVEATETLKCEFPNFFSRVLSGKRKELFSNKP
jgi:hypothetical protein